METLRELGGNSVALYTIIGVDKYRIILITPDAQKAAEFPIKAADLYRKVAQFREVLQNPRQDPRPLAEELYRILVAPIAKDLQAAGAETLMWSLDGVLRYVPMAALHDGEKYMVERYRNVVFTPASRDRLKDEPSPQWKGLGLGVSKPQSGFKALPAVSQELRGIIREETEKNREPSGGVLSGKVMLDEAFTVETMKAALRQRYSLVHIASHFSFTPGNETNSFLLIGDGSHLSLEQIKASSNLFSGVELLTLSACNTAASGGGADGKEVEGFGVLAQRQGAKAVLASLWPVVDESTKLLMQNFYRLRNEGKGTLKVEALRQAQLSLLRGEPAARESAAATGQSSKANAVARYAHPFYWAPFILIGNWK
jgi:CHAT domain-containing protein